MPRLSRRFSVAPMMDCTDRHFRYFMRLLSKRVLLYTEMVVTGALMNGDRRRFLQHHNMEHPLALQIGGSCPEELAVAARAAKEWGYDEINLNVGCPSDNVQKGRFGACLMLESDLVAKCVDAMKQAAPDLPVTVKTRIGVDNQDPDTALRKFVKQIADAGCSTFIVHARKAWLKGLSPRANRSVPPLNYPLVYELKRENPHLEIIINGGIKTIEECNEHLQHVDGVMLGREIYDNPYLLAQVDSAFFGGEGAAAPVLSRVEAAEQMMPYLTNHCAAGGSAFHVVRHLQGLMHGLHGAKDWRRMLSKGQRSLVNNQVLVDSPQVLIDALDYFKMANKGQV
eukprot:TRINITY_DN737_c0_g1_i3.p1 TRINITY_DN737_c0_g1~~TRINITY_DN737_c0_g1_i3.p1  ORF type:complete len:340 (-),score=49.48 TRINITY_DN737_c0_g1_i3:7-1026(-)